MLVCLSQRLSRIVAWVLKLLTGIAGEAKEAEDISLAALRSPEGWAEVAGARAGSIARVAVAGARVTRADRLNAGSIGAGSTVGWWAVWGREGKGSKAGDDGELHFDCWWW